MVEFVTRLGVHLHHLDPVRTNHRADAAAAAIIQAVVYRDFLGVAKTLRLRSHKFGARKQGGNIGNRAVGRANIALDA